MRRPWRGRDKIGLVAQLLDRQIVGPDGTPVGKVDDLELRDGEDGLEVSALLVGTAALRDRVPEPARTALRLALRLTGGPDQARRIGLDQVTDLGSAVEVTEAAAEAAASPAEERFRRFIARIPGAGNADL